MKYPINKYHRKGDRSNPSSDQHLPDITGENDIKTFVHAFYERAADDERLGPVFNDVAEVDWDTHLPKMVDFWSNLLFQTGRYQGKPFRRHSPLPIEGKDFERWVSLFHQTIDAHFNGPMAEHTKEMASKIASSFAVRFAMMENEQDAPRRD